MCGIFGQVSSSRVNKKKLQTLVKHSEQRGMDSSGLIFDEDSKYKVHRADYKIEKLLQKVKPFTSKVVLGHSRLITNGLGDNQPVVRGSICAIHNGIIVNEKEVWGKLKSERKLQIDSELIVAITEEHLLEKGELSELPNKILTLCRGVIACALVIPEQGKIVLFSNNGSLYVGEEHESLFFASEEYPLKQIGCTGIRQIREEVFLIDIPLSLIHI